jgi:hypothetical protein
MGTKFVSKHLRTAQRVSVKNGLSGRLIVRAVQISGPNGLLEGATCCMDGRVGCCCADSVHPPSQMPRWAPPIHFVEVDGQSSNSFRPSFRVGLLLEQQRSEMDEIVAPDRPLVMTWGFDSSHRQSLGFERGNYGLVGLEQRIVYTAGHP